MWDEIIRQFPIFNGCKLLSMWLLTHVGNKNILYLKKGPQMATVRFEMLVHGRNDLLGMNGDNMCQEFAIDWRSKMNPNEIQLFNCVYCRGDNTLYTCYRHFFIKTYTAQSDLSMCKIVGCFQKQDRPPYQLKLYE